MPCVLCGMARRSGIYPRYQERASFAAAPKLGANCSHSVVGGRCGPLPAWPLAESEQTFGKEAASGSEQLAARFGFYEQGTYVSVCDGSRSLQPGQGAPSRLSRLGGGEVGKS